MRRVRNRLVLEGLEEAVALVAVRLRVRRSERARGEARQEEEGAEGAGGEHRRAGGGAGGGAGTGTGARTKTEGGSLDLESLYLTRSGDEDREERRGREGGRREGRSARSPSAPPTPPVHLYSRSIRTDTDEVHLRQWKKIAKPKNRKTPVPCCDWAKVPPGRDHAGVPCAGCRARRAEKADLGLAPGSWLLGSERGRAAACSSPVLASAVTANGIKEGARPVV